MQLEHTFIVPVPPSAAFDLLTDIQRVGPAMPGASITSVEGNTFDGKMTVKVGPLAMHFSGTGELTETDRESGTATIVARGADSRGSAGAEATVRATLHQVDQGTQVRVRTDLSVSGRAAQFGGSVMREVSDRIFGQFVDNLSTSLVGESASVAARPTPTGPAHAQEGLDVVGLLGASPAVRASARLVGCAALAFTLGYLLGKDRARAS